MIGRGSSCVSERQCKFAFPNVAYFECYVDGGFEKNSKYAYISTGAKADKAG